MHQVAKKSDFDVMFFVPRKILYLNLGKANFQFEPCLSANPKTDYLLKRTICLYLFELMIYASVSNHGLVIRDIFWVEPVLSRGRNTLLNDTTQLLR